MYCSNRSFSAFNWQVDIAMVVRNGHGAGQRQFGNGTDKGSYKFSLDIAGNAATATWSGVPNNSVLGASGPCEITLAGPVDGQGNIHMSMKQGNCNAYGNRASGSDVASSCTLNLKKLGDMFK
jgi:hypothetical protein